MSDIKLGLDRIKNIMNKIDNPQDKLNVIHIAGTNGKGSVGAYLETILILSGYKVGRYASPAVFDSMEIIKVSGQSITHEKYEQKIDYLKSLDEKATLFELETALAFSYFVEEKCDIAIIEVGLGGELDATNIVRKPLCEIITSISMDHMHFLGKNLKSIAKQKCGIIKPETKVITFNQDIEVLQVIKQEVSKKKAVICIADLNEIEDTRFLLERTQFDYKNQRYIIRMLGIHQIENALLAIETANYLNIDYKNIVYGIEKTVWRGRLDIISKNPLILLDGAHNEKAACNLKKAIDLYFKNMNIIYVVGVLADKEYEKMLEIMSGSTEKIITFHPENERGLNDEKLAETAEKYYKNVINAKNIQHALELVFTLDKTIKQTSICCEKINYNIYNKIDEKRYQITDKNRFESMLECLKKNGFIDKTDRENKKDTVFLVFGSLSFMKDIYYERHECDG